MAGIGGILCSFVKGDIRDLKTRVIAYQQVGFGGWGAHVTGRGDSSFTFPGVLYEKLGPIRTWIVQIEALQGNIISIVDDFGIEYFNCLVMTVGRPRKTTAIRPQDPVSSGVRAQTGPNGQEAGPGQERIEEGRRQEALRPSSQPPSAGSCGSPLALRGRGRKRAHDDRIVSAPASSPPSSRGERW